MVLRERLNSSTEYYYTVSTVSGGVTVTVRGNFSTPQYSEYMQAERFCMVWENSSYHLISKRLLLLIL